MTIDQTAESGYKANQVWFHVLQKPFFKRAVFDFSVCASLKMYYPTLTCKTMSHNLNGHGVPLVNAGGKVWLMMGGVPSAALSKHTFVFQLKSASFQCCLSQSCGEMNKLSCVNSRSAVLHGGWVLHLILLWKEECCLFLSVFNIPVRK